MNVAETFSSFRTVGVDTSPFIYLIERSPKYINATRECFRLVSSGKIQAVTSVLTLTELLTQPLKTLNTILAEQYREFLFHSYNLSVHPLGIAEAEIASSLRAEYSLRTPDALQLATAIASGCDAFLTNDSNLLRVDKIRIITLDSLL